MVCFFQKVACALNISFFAKKNEIFNNIKIDKNGEECVFF